MDEVARQRYYSQATADSYETLHLGDEKQQYALSSMIAMIELFGIRSVLDIGSGTGRAVFVIRDAGISAIGIGP